MCPLQGCGVHLIWTGMERMGQSTPTTAPSSSSIPQEILTDYQKPTRSPQTRTIVQHGLVNTKRHTMTLMTFHHTYYLRGWSKSTSTQSKPFHTLTARCHNGFVPPRDVPGGTYPLADVFRPELLRGRANVPARVSVPPERMLSL